MEESFRVIRENGKAELLEILDSLRGRKCLVVEPNFRRMLSEIIFQSDQQVFKENNVHQYDTANLAASFETDLGRRDLPDNVCYLVRPNFATMKIVSRHIRDCVKAGETEWNRSK
jgi:hypothetical protein